ncbi:nucleotidyltransferase domain-containing protein [Candidatus Gottesmanbacteria bacterium]|nr:nucleotidyltransferase domain-containing protein [Candidatus Gottesmanbacteria bacterium]
MNPSTVQRYSDRIVPILERYRVPKAAFFGSFVTGQFTRKSDVDILVLPPKGMSLLDFVALKQDIEDCIHEKVDLVSYHGISPYLRESILAGQQVFYEAT